MDFVLGVDGGNTKTIALVARCDGSIVASGRSGCSDIYGAGSPEKGLAELDLAIGAALQSAGVRSEQMAAAAFSLAGADWPEDFDLLHAALAARGFVRNRVIVNDAIGALRAGSAEGHGVSVVCGTGVGVGARAPDGRLWHSSWWQEVQGAQQLGQKMLNAVFRAELGLEPPTSLTARVLEFFGLPTAERVLHRLTARERPPRPDTAQLARALLDEAAAGDLVARRIVLAHGAGLGDYAIVGARRVGLAGTPFALVMAGGVLRHSSSLLREALVGRVRAAEPGARPILSRLEPAAGAVLLALDAAGVAVDDSIYQRVAASLPPKSLFETLS